MSVDTGAARISGDTINDNALNGEDKKKKEQKERSGRERSGIWSRTIRRRRMARQPASTLRPLATIKITTSRIVGATAVRSRKNGKANMSRRSLFSGIAAQNAAVLAIAR